MPSMGEDVEKRKLSHTAGGNGTWPSHLGRQLGNFFQKRYVKFLSYAAIPLLEIYPREIKTYVCVKTRTLMFIAVSLFITSKK